MEKKVLGELTTEQLTSKIKTLKGVIMVLSSLVVIYLFYFIYQLSAGTWDANNTLGSVMLGTLGVVISSTTVQYSRVVKILKDRNEEK
ncbi:MAG: hypothetical protein R3D00_20625 [Bacteroidia bacterium]